MNTTSSYNPRMRLFAEIIAASALLFASVYLTYRYYYLNTLEDIDRYYKRIASIEQGYLQSLPLYDDFTSPAREQKLRTYLLPAHLAVAAKSGLTRVGRDGEIQELIQNGRLARLDGGGKSLYYFYNVREQYRVLAPDAAKGLACITERLQRNINKKSGLPPVKIALSSLLRPIAYQNDLRAMNENAAAATSHSYGISFDIFYDDFFVSLPAPEASNRISEAILERIRTRTGFMLGDALRRQFHASLCETLMQLQDEGAIYAILEKHQRCYHVTILPPPAGAATPR